MSFSVDAIRESESLANVEVNLVREPTLRITKDSFNFTRGTVYSGMTATLMADVAPYKFNGIHLLTDGSSLFETSDPRVEGSKWFFLLKRKDSGDITIRRGREGDEKALTELLESLKEEDEVWRKMKVLEGMEKEWIHNLTKNDRAHNKHNPGKWLFFAFDGEKMVGHVNGITWDRAPPEAKQHVKNTKAKYNLLGKMVGHVGIAVHKDYRRRGLGKKLMRKAIQEAKDLEVEALTTSINTENTPMTVLAEKLGFTEHMRERKGERESILMKLVLI